MDSFEKINKFVGFAIKSQNLLIIALGQIAVNNPDKDLRQFRELIDIRFEELDNKYQNLLKSNTGLKLRFDGLLADYNRAKTLLSPFITGQS